MVLVDQQPVVGFGGGFSSHMTSLLIKWAVLRFRKQRNELFKFDEWIHVENDQSQLAIDKLSVTDSAVLFFEIFGQQAVNLQQPFAS